PAVAVDGIDELLSVFLLAFAGGRSPSDGRTVHLHATDAEGEWSLNVRPDFLETHHEHTKGDVAIRARASDLLLWAVNRKSPDSADLELFGDRALLDAWGQMHF
ncbi:MAG: hypothetical protein QOK39_1057, partial [Acidimicrobiaceae bacterium]|nr:hypothetical protein [Acidimicrobiaceae bacterium]